MPLINEAARQTHELLIAGAYKPMEVATVMGISVDKLIGLRRLRLQTSAPADGLAGILGQLADHGGGSVTMTVETAKCIDVSVVEEHE